MSQEQILMLVAIIVYMAIMIIIGAYYVKRNKDVGDYYLGGRKLGPLVTAMSAEASDMSSYLLMGLPGLAYLTGLCDVTWTCIGLAVGTYLNWLLTAKRIRIYSEKVNAITIPDFFSSRYADKKKILAAVAAIIIIIFFVPYTASGFKACGVLFSTIFGIEYIPAMLISAVVIIVYTTLGGFLAASFTDFIQSIIMTAALIAILAVGVTVAGGFENVFQNASELPGYLSMTMTHDAETMTAVDYGGPLMIASTLSWGLGYFGMPHILLRFMAIKDNSKLKLSRRVATVWVVISMAIAIMIGVIGLGMSNVGAIGTLAGGDSESVIIRISEFIAQYGWLCAIFAGVVLSGILAATMSTSDSQLLAASSSISENIFKGTLKMKLSKRTSMIIARVTVIGVAIVAALIALDVNSTVFNIVSFAWAGFGATFGPVVILSLFWKRSNFQGAIAGMITGGVMVFVWEYLLTPLGGVFTIYELLPSFIVAMVVNIIVSACTKAPDQSVVDTFNEVKAEVKSKA